jgi:hypothetical protein
MKDTGRPSGGRMETWVLCVEGYGRHDWTYELVARRNERDEVGFDVLKERSQRISRE